MRSPGRFRPLGCAHHMTSPVARPARAPVLPWGLDARSAPAVALVVLVLVLLPVWALLMAFGGVFAGLFALGRLTERCGWFGSARVNAALYRSFVDDLDDAPAIDIAAAPQAGLNGPAVPSHRAL